MSNQRGDALAGLTILVVEDDYYQASDMQAAFENAGAAIAGPFSTAQEALMVLEQTPPNCAVIDINLGEGPDFGLARELKRRGIPTVFVSGYQATILPPDLRDVAHLEKPAERRSLVRAVREAAQAAHK